MNENEIETKCFKDCKKLTHITIPSSVTEIGDNAFSFCSSLTQITIPSSVTEIGEYAFYKFSSLTQITIPSSVTSIGNYAFSGCSSLPPDLIQLINNIKANNKSQLSNNNNNVKRRSPSLFTFQCYCLLIRIRVFRINFYPKNTLIRMIIIKYETII